MKKSCFFSLFFSCRTRFPVIISRFSRVQSFLMACALPAVSSRCSHKILNQIVHRKYETSKLDNLTKPGQFAIWFGS